MSVMLYSHPKTIEFNEVNKGFVTVDGEDFDYIVVNEDEVEACIREGFYRTVNEALKGESNETTTTETKKDAPTEEEKSEYTREELESLAESNGITFRSNISDKTLLKKIKDFLNN